jgi:hypothetical protein
MSCSWNSNLSPFSFSRENAISKWPVVVAQRRVSAETTAVHRRSSVGGCISESFAFVTVNVGLHTRPATAGAIPDNPMLPTRSVTMHVRGMKRFCSGFLRRSFSAGETNSRRNARAGCAGIELNLDIGVLQCRCRSEDLWSLSHRQKPSTRRSGQRAVLGRYALDMPGDCNQTRRKFFDANQTESQAGYGTAMSAIGPTLDMQIAAQSMNARPNAFL